MTGTGVRSREEALVAAVTHLLDLQGYRPEEYAGETDHSRCEVWSHTDGGPVLNHDDEDGKSHHPAHDESDRLAGLMVEAFDTVLEPWFLERLDAERERLAVALEKCRDDLLGSEALGGLALLDPREAALTTYSESAVLLRTLARPDTDG